MLKNEFQTQCETGIICNFYPTCNVHMIVHEIKQLKDLLV